MMIEKTVLDFLQSALAVPVCMEVSQANEFVLIEKTGSSNENRIFTATLAVQSYSTSLYKASRLNEDVKNAMQELDELDCICSCKLNSDYNYTDTTTKRYRYQAVFDIAFYA